MEYLALKALHVGCAILSIAGFAARGVLMLRGSQLLETRWLRVVPHVVDTVLLASALWLTILIDQYPFAEDWLTAKVLALVAYVVLGSIALKRGRTKGVRTVAFALALGVAAYIVTVALTRDPLGVLVLLRR